jgi:hypothetical protein
MVGREPHRSPEGVPAWHPLLRTASLLRLGRQEVDDLMCLADELAKNPVRPLMASSPQEVARMVAADLWQCRAELEIFDDMRDADEWRAFRDTRRHLTGLVAAMHPPTGGGPGFGDTYNPLRALAALRIGEPTRSALGRLGARAAEYFEDNPSGPRLMNDLLHAVAVGVHADLDYLLSVLRQQVERTDGPLKAEITAWVRTLEREVEVLRLVVPSIKEEDQEITWTEIPVPDTAREEDADG